LVICVGEQRGSSPVPSFSTYTHIPQAHFTPHIHPRAPLHTGPNINAFSNNNVRQFQNIDQRNFQAINVAGDKSDNNRVGFNVQNTQQQVAGAVLGEFGGMGKGEALGLEEG